MSNNNVYLYVLNTLADWEIGYITSELNSGRYFRTEAPRFSVRTFSAGKSTITTMGGVQIVPNGSAEDVRIEDAGLLLLPGADVWHESEHKPVFLLVERFLAAGIPVAAICGATVALANVGF